MAQSSQRFEPPENTGRFTPAWIDESFQMLERTEGPISIRRAYGSSENLKGLADTLRTWAVRPFVNLSLPKNTTDMSLAVDAMELACMTPRPKLIVIGSGDLDFVPLVVRLRERGIKVVCVTERSKMSQDAAPAYDQVIHVGGNQLDRPVVMVTNKAGTTPIRAVAKKVAAKAPAATTPSHKLAAAKKTPVKKILAKKSMVAETVAVTVLGILTAAPNLKAGEWQPLGDVAKVLHDKKLLAKNATSTKLFKKFPLHFELRPAGKPNQVRFKSR